MKFKRNLSVAMGLVSVLLIAILTGCEDSGSGSSNQSVPGDQANFDPIANYEAVHKAAGADMALYYISVYYVRSDGTLDLTASYKPNVDYHFARVMDAPPTDAPPIGVQGVTTDKWYDTADIYIKKDNMEIIRNHSQAIKTISAPTCPLRSLWSVALEKGAQKNAVATIDIRDTGYHFQISALKVDLVFGNDCHLIASH
jgi:hypothetical protein